MGLGAERHSLPLEDAVVSCAPRPSELQQAGEGAVGVSAACVTLSCVKGSNGVSRPEGSAAVDTKVVVVSAAWAS